MDQKKRWTSGFRFSYKLSILSRKKSGLEIQEKIIFKTRVGISYNIVFK